MDLLMIAGTSFAVALSGAMMPGPLLTVNISETLSRGFWAGPMLMVGHAAVEFLLLIGVTLGLGSLLTTTTASMAIAIVGGIVLLWMAFGMLRGAWRHTLSLSVVAETDRGRRMGPVLAGGIVSVSNPYWIVWWVTVGLSYVAWASTAGWVGLMAFFGGHILGDTAWYSAVALVVASGRQWLNDRTYRGLIFLCGLFLVGLSCYFLVSGLRAWSA